ncbi:type II toxin-antitoxin system RelE/ParE family toxin [Paenirhodobacter populi]|uniref:Type II toxin-antitoxin system RelE/ParE family toxin n=1 Tax=Paenirhodobacter populi TaxID=2306993 RepID=A0A443JRG2_9RHOB|nr:type II toxin-antitoxin system RelE/ParE family toxin [Sinirhodobacter populi]RWR23104.1 type II toxin-antitoxin system RelE/ParE family toxin [Sinirhodobacter populi]
MRLIRHPLVGQDLIALVDHIVEVTQGDFAAATRRLDEIDAMLADIAANPKSGMRLRGPLQGWLVRHGGQGHRLTIVFRTDADHDAIYVALVAFGGQDWMTTGTGRRDWGQ